MTISVSGVLAPFGKPVKNAKIIIESLNTDESLKGSELRYNTNALGEYAFTMENGLSLVRYIHKDVMNTLGVVSVRDSTPSDIDLVQLIKEYAIKEVDDITTSDVMWETQLETHIASTDKLFDISQASTENALATDYEEASEEYNSSLARSSDIVKSKHSKAKEEVYSFSIDGNTLISMEKSQDLPNGLIYESSTISEDADGVIYVSSDGFDANGLEVSNSIDSRNTTTKLNHEISGLGVHRKHETSVVNESIRETNSNEVVNDGYILNSTENVSYSIGYEIDNAYAYKPEIKQIIVSHIGDDTQVLAHQEIGSHLRIDEDDQVQTVYKNNLTVYEKTAIDEIENNGLLSKRLIDVDELNISDVVSVNKEDKTLTVSGKLIIDNVEDFKGDSTLAKYQYSIDGITYWHDDFTDGDLWRRDGTSVNGATPNDWTAPYKLFAIDGEDGDTIYIEYRYSSDTLNWHYNFLNGDEWRQERTITNGFPTTQWSLTARIKGVDGIAGDTIYIEYEYSVDGFDPWHTNFSTGDHYRRERVVTNGVYGAWSDSAKLVPEKDIDYYDGEQGKHGSGSYIVTVIDEDSIPDNTGKDANLAALAEREAQAGDILSYRDDEDTFVRQYLRDDTSWTEFTFAVNGNAIINGTLAAEALISHSVTADQIAAGAVTADAIDSNTITSNKLSSDEIFSIHIEAKSLTFVDGADMSALQGLFESPVAGDNLLPYEYTNVNSSNPPTLSNTEGVANYSYKLPIEGNLLGINALRLERLGNTEAYTYLAENAQEGNIVFLEKGKVTVSFSAYAHAAGTTDVYLYVDGVHVGGTVAIVQGWGEYAVTLDLGNTSGNKGCLRLDNDIPDSAIQSTMFFANIKVEIGTQATPFTQGVGVTATEAENARIAWSNENIYESQSPLQISGGGYETDNTQGWGIKSNGYAEFLGGINVKNATIEGATIIGGDIYSGNIYFTIDYNTDGLVDTIKYIDYPSTPLSASSSYSSFITKQVSIVDGQTNTYATGAYNAVTCTKKWGSVNASRFRWGMIRERAFEVKADYGGNGWLAHDKNNREVSYYVKIRFHHHTGITESGIDITVGKKSRPAGEAINKTNSITVNGLTFMIKTTGEVRVTTYGTRSTILTSIEVYNLAGTHYNLTDSTKNGAYEIQLIFGADTENATSTKMTVESTLTVNNDTFPG